MIVLTMILVGMGAAWLIHGLLTLRYALSDEWKLANRLKRYV